MFFTKIGKILAYIGFGLGFLRVATGYWIAFGATNANENLAAARRYLAASGTGEAINEGYIYMLVSVALGILCEISSNQKVLAVSVVESEKDEA